MPPDDDGIDERARRRLGDATKGRIAELASGWSVDGEAAPEPALPPPPASGPTRQKPRTLPPPPPGSAARAALEASVVESATPVPIAAPRTKPPSAPPRPKRASAPPQGVARDDSRQARAAVPELMKSGPTQTGTVTRSGVIGGTPRPELGPARGRADDAIPIADHSGAIVHSAPVSGPQNRRAARISDGVPVTMPPPPPPRTKPVTAPPPIPAAAIRPPVPLGEFEDAGTRPEPDQLRVDSEQSTIKREAANALLGIAEPAGAAADAPRGDPTALEAPETVEFERGDPTLAADDVAPVAIATSGKLRSAAALRRKRGIGGDLRYVATVLFGVRRARTELVALDALHRRRLDERRRHLVTLGRAAVVLDAFAHPALGPAREQLAKIEDERSQHAGAVVAADAELARVKRDREAKAQHHAEELARLDAELAELARKLEPLDKEAASIRRRATELRDALRRIDGKIAATEASQHAVGRADTELAAIQAQIATLKADRIAVQRDEPRLAAELDALEPRLAAHEARRTEARRQRDELERDERDDQKRTEELLAAIGAKRKVVDRAASDAEALRDKVLFELGERLYVDRPDDLAPQLAPIDDIDVDLGTCERRMMELREIISSVDTAKLARGIALAVALVAMIGGVVAYVLYLAL